MTNALRILVPLAGSLVLSAQPKQLAVERIALHQFEDGPVLAPGHEFVAGETVYFSCRLIGYRVEKKEDEQHVKLSWQMRVMDPLGVLVEKDKSGAFEDDVLPQDKNWMPKFLSSFILPPLAPSGVYRIPVKVKDEFGGTEVSGELTFRVKGHEVERSESLVARNFQFLRSEDDAVGLRTAIYHPGQMLWARFDITGYKFGDNNRFSVDYGLAVLNGSGQQVFSRPIAASESNESFYPQHYVPGMLSLGLDQNVPKGPYTLVVTVRDKTGDQTWESRQPFQVE